MTEPVYLVDASIYIFRAYFSLPDRWHAPNGYAVNALYGYVQFWLQLLQQTRPQRIAAAYDESLGSCFRNAIHPGYKVSRVLPDEALAFQLAACRHFTEILGVVSPASERYEADDILATLAAGARRQRAPVIVVSRDKDLGQLLQGPADRLWDFAADQWLDRDGLGARFGVAPEQLADYLALVGDSIDDVPGVPGIGGKTAAALLQRYGDIDTLLASLASLAVSDLRGAGKLAARLDEYRDQIALSRQLVTLYTTVPLDRRTRAMRWRPPTPETVRYYLDEFGLGDRFAPQLERCEWWS